MSLFQSGHYQNDYLSIRSVKAFIDGALGSRGAALHEPYCDDHNNCGLILISQDEFDDLVNQCYKYNFQLNRSSEFSRIFLEFIEIDYIFVLI